MAHWEDWSASELSELLSLAAKVKQRPRKYQQALEGRALVMLFQKSSTRTRLSFELGMAQLGGHSVYLDWMSTNIALSELSYEAVCLSQHATLIMARLKEHSQLLELQAHSQVPVINGCCNRYHPCQSLSDMLTIYEDRGQLRGTKLCYVGVYNNVVNTLVQLAYLFQVELYLVCPLASKEIIDEPSRQRLKEAGLLHESLSIKEAVAWADYVYTDTWLDMEFFGQEEYAQEQKERVALMQPYQLNAALLQDSHAKIMHDMPIHAGYEISAELVEDSRSIIYAQAENRLHAQKAIMLCLLGQA